MKIDRNKVDWNLAFTVGIFTGVWTTLVYLMVS